MSIDHTGPQLRPCFICKAQDMAPALHTYVASSKNPDAVETKRGGQSSWHVFAHQLCMASYMEAHRKSLGILPYKYEHEHGDCA